MAGCVAIGLVGPLAVAACVTPKDDYDDFLARTAGARALVDKPAVDASCFEETFPDGGLRGTYYIACLPSIALGDVTQALSFQGNLEILPAVDGGSNVMLSTMALATGATDLSQTVGTTNLATGAFDAMCAGDAVYASQVIIPPSADSAMPNLEAVIAPGATFTFHLSSSTGLCAGLAADVLKPIVLKLSAANNPCLFFPFPQPSGPLPTLAAADFHCP